VGDVADADVIRFVIWAALLLAITVASTAVVTSEAEARAPAELSGRYLAWWAIASGVSILILSILGGLVVFQSTMATRSPAARR
jgi:small-conductance mechanosensitive channel